jgi:hypothetical protein
MARFRMKFRIDERFRGLVRSGSVSISQPEIGPDAKLVHARFQRLGLSGLP